MHCMSDLGRSTPKPETLNPPPSTPRPQSLHTQDSGLNLLKPPRSTQQKPAVSPSPKTLGSTACSPLQNH